MIMSKTTYILPSDFEVELDDAQMPTLKILKKAIKLRDEIGAIATWCEEDEVGRYNLNLLINNLAAMIDPTVATCKLLR
jgi:hypothetical protein